MPAEQRRVVTTLAVGVCLLLTGCIPTTPPSPAPTAPTAPVVPTIATPSSTAPAASVFTILMRQAPTSLDPAGAKSDADATVALDVFQRLLTLKSSSDEPKPDAGDCLFSAPTVYRCTVLVGLRFSNGRPLTASDVKFSIDRAMRLKVPGVPLGQFASIDGIDLVDAQTLQFRLKWPDRTIGQALASPQASIVDEDTYSGLGLKAEATATGSGPFTLASTSSASASYLRNDGYFGPNKPTATRVNVVYAVSDAAAEQAVIDGQLDIAWDALPRSGDERILAGVTSTDLQFAELGLVRQRRLQWSPASAWWVRADVRSAVVNALTADRTAASLVPMEVLGSTPSFPTALSTMTRVSGVRMTLAFSSRDTDAADAALIIRDRIERSAGIGVTLAPDASTADLRITRDSPSSHSALGWLGSYLDAPLPGSAAKLSSLRQTAASASDDQTRDAVLAEIQQQSAADATVIPVAEFSPTVLVLPGVTINPESLGPCQQLTFWGITS